MRFKVKYEPYIQPKSGDRFTRTFFTIYTRVKDEVRMFERVTVEYEWVIRSIVDKFGNNRKVFRVEKVRFIDKED